MEKSDTPNLEKCLYDAIIVGAAWRALENQATDEAERENCARHRAEMEKLTKEIEEEIKRVKQRA